MSQTTAIRSAGPVVRGAPPLALVVLGSGAPAAVHRLDGPVTIGRAPSCGIPLDDATVSRVHARISPHGNGIEVADLESGNGTFVNGRAIKQEICGPRSLIRVGDTLFCSLPLTEEWVAAASDGPLVGGTALAGVKRTAALVGPTALPVLITGETGTGKEVVAHMLHAASQRSGPLVAVNCAALPESLAESELFGHARGAFTGAARSHRGLIAAASGGTLFLDEVGDLPGPLQAKFLRVLEDGLVRPVGSETSHKVDVRIISATNRPLQQEMASGRFRSDLYARIAPVEIRIPPLRERPEDLPVLMAHLLARHGGGEVTLTADALEALCLYGWPHNVRELDGVVRQFALARVTEVALAHLPERLRDEWARRRGDDQAPSPRKTPKSLALARAREEDDQRGRLEKALRDHGGNVRQASVAVGIARAQVYRLMQRWGIDPGSLRSQRGPGIATGVGQWKP